MAVRVQVGVAEAEGVAVSVAVKVGESVGVAVIVGESVGVDVGVQVGVGDAEGVAVSVAVRVGEPVGVAVRVGESVGVTEEDLREWVVPRQHLGVFTPRQSKTGSPNYMPGSVMRMLEADGFDRVNVDEPA